MKQLNAFLYARSALTLSLTSFVALSSASALAQLPTDASRAATGVASPDRVQEQFLDRELAPRVSAPVAVEDLVLEGMPANADQIRFNLQQIEFDGIGAYTAADIESIYGDKLGTEVSLADIYGIALALTNKYRNDGYILTRVYLPPQTIEGGVVKLRAVEGFVDNITVEGDDQESALKLVRQYASRIRSGGALNVAELEKFLLIINDLPGLEARSILSPSKTTSGASDLRIIVERDPYDAVIAIDNHGSRYLGPVQVSAGGSLNSFFGNNERITAQFAVAPDKGGEELVYFALGYDQPIGTYGTVIRTTYNHASTEPGFDLSQFDVRGRSDFASIGIEHPFMRSRDRSFFGRIGFDWRDVESRNDLEPTREDSIRAVRVGGRYEFLDSLFGAGANLFDFEFSRGVDIFGASSPNRPTLSRPAGDPTFTKANLELQRLQRITTGVNLLIAASGQLSNNALLSSEEFGVGGQSFGRGYDPSEIVGDEGFAGKAEIQWREPAPLSWVDDYQLYGFYDFGRVWNVDPTTNADKTNSLASVGVGVRADFPENVKAGVSLARPLTRDVETQRDDDTRVFFNLSKGF